MADESTLNNKIKVIVRVRPWLEDEVSDTIGVVVKDNSSNEVE